ncbi:sensor histidine kinase [Corynebacterium stationis]|uniref:ATPase n=1 Tax=Corynebacterium stationis TaxID=1705 RepID=A0A0X8VFW7_9CORY|nr:sensor histidine kinase [Corynebacterium stationis]AMJ45575.1 ATPase [Corynebacterium stationis]APT96028.1 ATPase [Corynebacterium stationis]AQX72031.1 sensor histidine kinase [Corynebacterium stationis]ASJ19710.1 ATPase [Corynebacterium stationis]OAH30288.1 ATPase [Corynebacterium stationis]
MSYSLDQDELEAIESSEGAEIMRNGVHILTATILVVAILMSVRMDLSLAVLNLVLLSLFAGLYFVGSYYLERMTGVWKLAWLIALTVVWIADILVASAGIYLLFVLFFLYLRVLGMVWGSISVIFGTAVSVGIQIPQGLTFGGVMGPVVSALVTVAIFYAFTRLHEINTERTALIRELMETREQLAETERAAGVAGERQRIAHEIHDTLAQGLSSIQMLLHAANRDLDGDINVDKARERIGLARQTAADNLQEARAMIAALQPAALSQTSLVGALDRMAQGFAAAADLNIEVEADGEVTQLPMKLEAVLLRIAQGAVGNVAKHAQATRARITVSYSDDAVRVDIVDNGVGFDVKAVESRPAGLGHIGLAAMKRRAEEVSGEVVIESSPGNGTAVSVSVPLTTNAH